MPRDLEDVLDYLLPGAPSAVPAAESRVTPGRDTVPDARTRSSRPAALPILALPIGDRDVVRAAFAWNLAVEIARLGASATLLAPSESNSAPLWPPPGRGPIGAEFVLVQTGNLQQLNHAALDIAVSRAADSSDGGVVLVRVPLDWIRGACDSRALLRWVLLFASPEPRDLQEAYGLAKCVLRSGAPSRVGITIHGARRIREAERAFGRLAATALRHLQHSVVSYGLLVDDLQVYRAIVARRPIGLEHPQSRAARALRDVAWLVLEDARNQVGG